MNNSRASHAKASGLRFVVASIVLAVCGTILSGCLFVERKHYTFVVNADGSGTGTIVFENIMSIQEDASEPDQALKDYTQLVLDYFKGNRFEQEHAAFGKVRKRLYEKDGKLFGEVSFDFLAYEDVGLYRYQSNGPWMYFVGALSGMNIEQVDTSNGTFGGEKMPVIFWPDGSQELKFTTRLEQPESSGRAPQSLLPIYKRVGTE